MIGAQRGLRIALAAQTALAATAALLEAVALCGSCGSGGFWLALAGLLFYGALLALALRKGFCTLLFDGILFAFGVHVALGVRMFLQGAFCTVCAATAVGSVALVVLSIVCDRTQWRRLELTLPGLALLVFGVAGPPTPSTALPPASAAIRIEAFLQADCSYCEELRETLMPQIDRDFGSRVEIVYRSSDGLDAIRRTPTLILTPPQPGRKGRVIEGLPTIERLRAEILELEAKP